MILKWVLGLGVAVSVASGAVWKIYAPVRTAANDLPIAVEAYKKAGLPWVAADLDRYANLPDDKNAAQFLGAAAQVMGGLKWENDFKNASALIASGHLAGAESILANYLPVAKYASLAAQREHLTFHRNWSLGPAVLLPEESSFKSIVRTLGMLAQLEAAKGHGAASASYLQSALRISALVNDEPVLIGSLVSIACRSLTLNSVSQAAALLSSDPPELERFVGALSIDEVNYNLPDSLRGEAFMGVTVGRNPALVAAALQQTSSSSGPVDTRPTVLDGVPAGMNDRAVMDRILRYWLEEDAIMKGHPNDPQGAAAALDQLAKTWENHKIGPDAVASQLVPVFSQAGLAMVQSKALGRTTEALLKVLEFKAQNGHFPADLSQVGKWTDPFGGGPLRMIVGPKSVKVYSVGPDKIDDHGTDESQIKNADSNTGWDIVSSSPPLPPSSRG